MTSGHREWEVGLHRLRVEPLDVLWVTYHGALCLREAIRMMEISRELGASRPFFMIGDMRKAGLPDMEAGRYVSEHLRFEWFLGTVYIGMRLLQKATAKGILLAAHMNEQSEAHSLQRIHFVLTPEEALALIAQLRASVPTPPLAAEMNAGLALPGVR